MKTRHSLVLPLSAALLIFAGAQLSRAQSQGAEINSETSHGQILSRLVPAEAELDKTLDARKVEPGAAFDATLKSSVRLKDGTELPEGTRLEGKVAAASAKSAGASQLALEFTVAKLKDGKDVPIEATIVGLADPVVGTDSNSAYDGPTKWDGSTTQFDLMGALDNVDLHSAIGSENSGTLTASGKDTLKLDSGSRISLALGDKSAD